MLPVTDPEVLIRKQKIDPETLEDILKIQLERARFAIKYRGVELNGSEISDVIDCVSEFTQVTLTEAECQQFVDLYPEVCGNVRDAGIDSETRSLILDCFCTMLIGTTFKEDDVLLNMVKTQAAELWKQENSNG